MLDMVLTKREKMLLSGDKFEFVVATKLLSIFDYPILIKRQFYDARIYRSMECDLIFITPFKIYCIECKHYKGYIAGNKFDKDWILASSGRKNTFQNPYLLNKRRIRVMRGFFYKNNYNPPSIENIIVVPDSCAIHSDYKKVFNVTDFINLVTMDSVTNKSIYKERQLAEFIFNCSTRRIN